MEKVKDITLDEILFWIVKNSDDTEAIDKINKASFPYIARYAKWQDNQ